MAVLQQIDRIFKDQKAGDVDCFYVCLISYRLLFYETEETYLCYLLKVVVE